MPILEPDVKEVTGRSSATLADMRTAVLCLCAVARTLRFERARAGQEACILSGTKDAHCCPAFLATWAQAYSSSSLLNFELFCMMMVWNSRPVQFTLDSSALEIVPSLGTSPPPFFLIAVHSF